MSGLWNFVVEYKIYVLSTLLAIIIAKLWRKHAKRKVNKTQLAIVCGEAVLIIDKS
jgi:hypothetical protein